MSRLPVRTAADVHLADAFALPGCPLCRDRGRREAAFLESILAESVNDVGFRQTLDAGRGFCGGHGHAVLAADRRRSGSLGAAILLRASLRVRLLELEAVHAARGRARSKPLGRALAVPACPVCGWLAASDGRLIEALVARAEEPTWAEAVAGAPVCLDHLLRLVDRHPVPAWWPPIEARQLARLAGLLDRLERFAHASAHDRRHLQTDAQRASVDEAADLLGGVASTWSRREG